MDFFHINNSEEFVFYRIPKILFTDLKYKNMSTDARVLYGVLLDRVGLSIKNKWIDDCGRVFIIFRREEVQELLGYKKDKIIKLFKELNDIGLIQEIVQGNNKPNIIYVKKFLDNDNYEPSSLVVSMEVGKTDIGKSKKSTPEYRKKRLPELEKTDSNNTNINNTNFINQSIYPEQQDEMSLTNDEDEIDGLIETEIPIDKNVNRVIKKNIGYNELKNTYPEIEDIYKLMIDTFTSNKKTMTINKEQIPIEKVRDRFLYLNSMHIEYVLECVTKQTNINNMRSYLLTALYNAPTSINSFYSNKVKNLLGNS
ncbi:MAG: replication initiator protein A [Bacilli bacterium]|nr:replication initiator protein A [Bacilli bacterium]